VDLRLLESLCGILIMSGRFRESDQGFRESDQGFRETKIDQGVREIKNWTRDLEK
jgi:hypothetical protein